jgi:predicted RNA-binding Zn-ribbon protein involved in translation (DUF1610 family)
MNDVPKNKGPWLHRFLISFFSVLFGLLILWLLNFIDRDIRTMEAPKYQDYEEEHIDTALTDREKELNTALSDADRQIAGLKNRQTVLRDSTDSLEKTMNQLLEIHRLNLENNITPTREEQLALADCESKFLSKQKEYDELNIQLTERTDKKVTLTEQRNELQVQLRDIREDLHEDFDEIMDAHHFKVSMLRLLAMIPILLLTLFCVARWRHGSYALMVYSGGIAVFLKLLFILHDYFPLEFFKYILIALAIVIVVYVLTKLIRIMTSPQKEWLLNQYREAYEKFMCPVCSFPIRRGPLKYAYWTSRTIKKLTGRVNGENEADTTYTCPSCGTPLFEECEECKSVRYSLLPHCNKCGHEKPFQP